MHSTSPLRSAQAWLRYDPKSGALRQRRYQLQVLSGARAGTTFKLEECTTVGTASEVALRLDDLTLSRRHFELTPRVEGVWVRDLGSTNGTYVGGVRIKEALVETEGIVVAGMTRLRIGVEEADLGRPSEMSSLGGVIGTSHIMCKLFGVLSQVAPTDSTVVLWGETGTGKEVLARAIHQTSHRAHAPFVVIDCASLDSNLVESELFGHLKGAFTGATTTRDGAFHQADMGTIFLDEIAELSLDLQPKLLRVLETQVVRRLGDERSRQVDVRVIAATRFDLEKEVAAGRFRQDLYFRLAVVPVQVPAFRERIDDLPALARHFLDVAGRADFQLPDSFLAELTKFEWPGNVRQLRNAIDRILSLGHTPAELDRMPASELARLVGQKQLAPPRKEHDLEKQRILDTLEKSGGNQTLAAKLLGMARNTLAARLDGYGVHRPRKKRER